MELKHTISIPTTTTILSPPTYRLVPEMYTLQIWHQQERIFEYALKLNAEDDYLEPLNTEDQMTRAMVAPAVGELPMLFHLLDFDTYLQTRVNCNLRFHPYLPEHVKHFIPSKQINQDLNRYIHQQTTKTTPSLTWQSKREAFGKSGKEFFMMTINNSSVSEWHTFEGEIHQYHQKKRTMEDYARETQAFIHENWTQAFQCLRNAQEAQRQYTETLDNMNSLRESLWKRQETLIERYPTLGVSLIDHFYGPDHPLTPITPREKQKREVPKCSPESNLSPVLKKSRKVTFIPTPPFGLSSSEEEEEDGSSEQNSPHQIRRRMNSNENPARWLTLYLLVLPWSPCCLSIPVYENSVLKGFALPLKWFNEVYRLLSERVSPIFAEQISDILRHQNEQCPPCKTPRSLVRLIKENVQQKGIQIPGLQTVSCMMLFEQIHCETIQSWFETSFGLIQSSAREFNIYPAVIDRMDPVFCPKQGVTYTEGKPYQQSCESRKYCRLQTSFLCKEINAWEQMGTALLTEESHYSKDVIEYLYEFFGWERCISTQATSSSSTSSSLTFRPVNVTELAL